MSNMESPHRNTIQFTTKSHESCLSDTVSVLRIVCIFQFRILLLIIGVAAIHLFTFRFPIKIPNDLFHNKFVLLLIDFGNLINREKNIV